MPQMKSVTFLLIVAVNSIQSIAVEDFRTLLVYARAHKLLVYVVSWAHLLEFLLLVLPECASQLL